MPSEQLAVVVEMMRSFSLLRGDRSIVEQRADLDALAGGGPLPDGTSCEPVNAGGVPCEWIGTPGLRTDQVLLYLHGGGYCVGSIASHRAHVARLSGAIGVRALVVDYRLAPEHPHPAAVDDAVTVYAWLLQQGVPPHGVLVAGDSAGGGLAVAMLAALRDAGAPLPAGGACISPWTDLALGGDSVRTRADADPMCRADGLAKMAAAYLNGADPRTPLASPIHADLRGLPPLLVHVGTAEILLDDAVRLAERARSHGVDVVLEPWDDMIHVWHVFAPLLPEANAAIDRLAGWARERLASEPPVPAHGG